MEEWRDIKGYEGLYQVSSEGRVRSLNYNHTGRIQVMKPQMNDYGYLRVLLSKNGKHKNCYLHRLVAEAFLTNPEGLEEVNHIDENKTNNCVRNLEWCTASHNINHGSRNARNAAALSKPVQQLSKDGRLVAVWPSMTEAWRQTGVSYGNICSCCKGKYHTAGGFVWKYVE